MPSLSETLGSIPGLAGYQAQTAANQAQDAGMLQQIQGVVGLQGELQKQQAAAQALRDAQTLKQALAASGGDPKKATSILLQSGQPALAAKLAPIIQAQTPKLQFAPAGSDVYRDGSKVGTTPAKQQPPLIRDNFPVDAAHIQPHISYDNGQTWQPIPGSAPQPKWDPKVKDATVRAVVGQDESGHQVVSWVDEKGVRSSIGLPTKAIGTGNLDFSAANQFAGRYQTSVKAPLTYLQAVDLYRGARSTGDNAQALQYAGQALIDAARLGGRQAQGRIDALLGGGYHGGSIFERINNYLNTLATGTPSQQTLDRLDKLVGAAEDAAYGQVARQAKFYASTAKARGIKVQQVTGNPMVFGTKVVFPDGDFATFKTPEDASNAAKKWLEANP